MKKVTKIKKSILLTSPEAVVVVPEVSSINTVAEDKATYEIHEPVCVIEAALNASLSKTKSERIVFKDETIRLHALAEARDWKKFIDLWHKSTCDVKKDINGDQLLVKVIHSGNLPIVLDIIEKGGDITHIGLSGVYPLQVILQYGRRPGMIDLYDYFILERR